MFWMIRKQYHALYVLVLRLLKRIDRLDNRYLDPETGMAIVGWVARHGMAAPTFLAESTKSVSYLMRLSEDAVMTSTMSLAEVYDEDDSPAYDPFSDACSTCEGPSAEYTEYMSDSESEALTELAWDGV